MSSERSQKSYKYWNLQSVVMSDYSLISTRNSHAKHNKSVGRIPEVRKTGGGVSADTEGLKTKLVDERKKNIHKSSHSHTVLIKTPRYV